MIVQIVFQVYFMRQICFAGNAVKRWIGAGNETTIYFPTDFDRTGNRRGIHLFFQSRFQKRHLLDCRRCAERGRYVLGVEA